MKDITEELQARINAVFGAGGGEVVVASGEWLFRPLELKSGVCLTLAAGCVLTASGKRSDYQPVGIDHNEMGQVYSALFAKQAADVSLRGPGTLDLNGDAFYHLDKPSSQDPEAPLTYDWRPNQPIFFHKCTNLRLQDLNVRNAPCWTFSFDRCQSVQVRGLNIRNSLRLPNNDGMHFCACRVVLVTGCDIVAGDDCVALSSITDWNIPCQDVVITDCVFQSASKAMSIGYMHSIVRNVLVANVVVKASNRAFVSMVHPHTGLVENVRVTNCLLEGRHYGGNWWGNGEAIVLMATPHDIPAYRDPMPAPRFDLSFRNVHFDQINCRAERPLAFVGQEPGLFRGVSLNRVVIDLYDDPRPNAKGDTIDLSPGPKNLQVPRPSTGVLQVNADLRLTDVSMAL